MSVDFACEAFACRLTATRRLVVLAKRSGKVSGVLAGSAGTTKVCAAALVERKRTLVPGARC